MPIAKGLIRYTRLFGALRLGQSPHLTACPKAGLGGYMLYVIAALEAWSVVFVVVSLHAFGHFIAAKLLGIDVSECAVGYGKTLCSRVVGGTVYCVKLVPLWVRVGWYRARSREARMSSTSDTQGEREGRFSERSLFVQATVILAGPLCSVLSAVLIAFLFFMIQGVDRELRGPIEIRSVLADSPAERAGLRAKDRLVSIDGQLVEGSHAVTMLISNSGGRALQLVIERPRGEFSLESATNAEFDRLSFQASPERISDHPTPDPRFLKGGYRLGIEMTPLPLETERFNVSLSAEGAIGVSRVVLTLLKNLVIARDVAEDSTAMSVFRFAKEPPELGIVTRVVLRWMFGLFAPSFLLGVINLLPLPFLDGGRLVRAMLSKRGGA
jgi:regulator of sigma E protease